jgi:hypothetical protein
LVFTPRTLERKRGRMFRTISLEMSMKKLVRLTAQMLRGRERRERRVLGLDVVIALTSTGCKMQDAGCRVRR